MTAPPINPTELRRPSLVYTLDLHCPLGTKYLVRWLPRTAIGGIAGAVLGIFIAAQLLTGRPQPYLRQVLEYEQEVRRVFENP